jgi:23S rRNA (guanine2445-N2)-methyltransferase / 23S rRNA (guanine2069-N7)-methyltransferase
MRHLGQDGLLIFSNNFRKFKMSPAIIESYLVNDITPQSIPRDFQRNPKIHNCWQISHRPPGARNPWPKQIPD